MASKITSIGRLNIMKSLPSILPFQKRVSEIDSLMAQPDFFQDAHQAKELTREYQRLSKLLELYSQLEVIMKDIREYQTILEDSDVDEELRILAEEELPVLQSRHEALTEKILLSMLPSDPNDSRNTIIEIRAGAGGDEASLFAMDLFRMYSRYAESKGWKMEILSISESEAGGCKEIGFLISGDDVYRTLKYESGVHRVQRVPVTETNGRIHTSTVTVAVLPEAEEVDIKIDPSNLEISVCRASGPGGQSVNTTDSAVQILHKPTGMIVQCADERSQLKNKNKALKVLRSRLLKQKEEEEQAKYAANRRSQVGTGDRSERIRTYNFPQGRMTDHRINLTLYSLLEIMEGKLNDIFESLEKTDQEEKLKCLVEETIK